MNSNLTGYNERQFGMIDERTANNQILNFMCMKIT